MYVRKLTPPSLWRGFTLIELLVVLVILGLLAGLVGPQVMKYLSSANTDTARLQVENLNAALDAYRLEVGRLIKEGVVLICKRTERTMLASGQ